MEENASSYELRIENKRGEQPVGNQPARQALRSLVQAGLSLLVVPVNLLPTESRQHVVAAARELTHGIAALTRELADSLDRLADDPPSPQQRG